MRNATHIRHRAFGLLCSFVCVSLIAADAEGQQGSVTVAANRYIITRKAISTSSSASTKTSYVTHAATGYFDLVSPQSASQSLQSAAVELEPLNFAKVQQACAEIKQDPSIASCEPDMLLESVALPDDPMFSQQWGLNDTANDADIDAPAAWDRGTGSKSIIIGVIDSGIYTQHPDLIPNFWANPADPADGIDNDGNGYADDVFGVNTAKGSSNPEDCFGHGTHVAGIIGAKGNNGAGVTGVNWTANIISANIHHDCTRNSFLSSALAAYNYFYDLKVRGHDIRVLNASYGGYGFSDAAYQAIARLNQVGILFVAAVGNEAKNTDSSPFYPALYDLPNVIAVAATGANLNLASYSNYGSRVHIAAPGGDLNPVENRLLSTYSPLAEGGSLYAHSPGTSMASPMVAGTIALVASQVPSLSAAQLKEILLTSAYSLSSLEGKVNGARFLNAKGMAELAASRGDACPNDPSKTSPGICGCGVADTDSDGDGTADCQDSCPSDGGKVSAGACGCGVADTDSDGDGTANCQDACPSDRGKTSPGACGCGIADSDANGNGSVDCRDVGISTVIPDKPRLQLGRDKVYIRMAPRTGMSYYLEITVTLPRSFRRRPITKNFEVKNPYVMFNKPPKGSRVQVRYAYFVAAKKTDVSYWSYFSSLSVRR